MASIESFRDVDTYKMLREQVRRIFEITRPFPREERYALTDQIRRSSRAVKAMIARAWERRRYQAAFENKIKEALGEAMETQSWLDDALDCDYTNREVYQALDEARQNNGGKLSRMIQRSDTFCGKRST